MGGGHSGGDASERPGELVALAGPIASTPSIKQMEPGFFWSRDYLVATAEEQATLSTAEFNERFTAAVTWLENADVPGVQEWMPHQRMIN